MKPNEAKVLKIKDKEVEALLCCIGEWFLQNRKYRDAESVALNKLIAKLERKLRKI